MNESYHICLNHEKFLYLPLSTLTCFSSIHKVKSLLLLGSFLESFRDIAMETKVIRYKKIKFITDFFVYILKIASVTDQIISTASNVKISGKSIRLKGQLINKNANNYQDYKISAHSS